MKTENLPLVKTIKASNNLSPQKKTAVIKKISRIYNSRNERTYCNFCETDSYLNSAFVWSRTKEGHNYWNEIHDMLAEY